MKSKRKSRRATVIVSNNQGILLTRMKGDSLWMLPGGYPERYETRETAAKRELFEETSLVAVTCNFLFEFESSTRYHKVFLIDTQGVWQPSTEIEALGLYKDGKIRCLTTEKLVSEASMYKSSREIINTFARMNELSE
jgi:8-oxo-dGTP pyrophosphatase MutT (NUDIX family)